MVQPTYIKLYLHFLTLHCAAQLTEEQNILENPCNNG